MRHNLGAKPLVSRRTSEPLLNVSLQQPLQKLGSAGERDDFITCPLVSRVEPKLALLNGGFDCLVVLPVAFGVNVVDSKGALGVSQ